MDNSHRDLLLAQQALEQENCTLAAAKDGEIIFRSDRPGIGALLETALKDRKRLRDSSAADRITGKAAAMLMVLCGIKSLYSKTLSRTGKAFLEKNSVGFRYENLTETILNRKGDGLCPFEACCIKEEDPEKALSLLAGLMEKLRTGNS